MVVLSVTAPTKSLPFVVRSIVPAPASNALVCPTDRAPDWLILPVELTASPPAVTVATPKSISFASVIVTAPAVALVVLSETAPVKSLALSRVMTPAPALKVTAPAFASWVIAPV